MIKSNAESADPDLITDISLLIEQSQRYISRQANSILTLLFWKIGKRMNDDILKNKRAGYGKQVVATVAEQLERNYGRNFSERNLRRMIQFSELFPEFHIVSPLATQLSWSHFIELFSVKTKEARMFYALKN